MLAEYWDCVPDSIYSIAVIIAAGRTIWKLALNLSLNSQFCVLVAAIVVSEMSDRLSPKKAPPTTMATTRATGSPVFVAIPEAIGTSAAVVPTDVPMLSDTA